MNSGSSIFQTVHLSQDRDDRDRNLMGMFGFLPSRIDVTPMRYPIATIEQLVLKVP
jgi:hypothetical protein